MSKHASKATSGQKSQGTSTHGRKYPSSLTVPKIVMDKTVRPN